MKIKVCGITVFEQLVELQEMGVDYAGLIFYNQSPRFVLHKIDSNNFLLSKLIIQKVGVFVNASEEEIMKQVEAFALDLVQLHGDETPAFCAHISDHVKVIKAFRLNNKSEQHIDWMVKPYEEACDYYLFDTKTDAAYGGSGEKFNWSVFDDNHINKPFFLSGGIGIHDAEAIRQIDHPFLFAVDLNSGFELEPGIKDMGKLRSFIKMINKNETLK